MSSVEVIRELWKVTEWRDGAVFHSESLGCVWLPIDSEKSIEQAQELGGDFFGNVSTSYKGPRCRRIRDDNTIVTVY